MSIKDKREFFRELSKKNDVTMDEAEAIWGTILEIFDETFSSSNNGYVHLPQLGKMKIYTREPREYKNPYTQQYEMSEPRRTVKLHVYPSFRERYENLTDK